MNSRFASLLGAPVALCLASLSAHAADAVFDFSASNGGWTASTESGVSAGPFVWGLVNGANAWSANGDATGTAKELVTSPVINITSTTTYSISFAHRFNFEIQDPQASFGYDGGIVQYRVNAGSWTTIPKADFSAEPYNLDSIDAFDGGNPPFQPGFSGESAGNGVGSFITSIASFGTLSSGSTLEVRFRGAWDTENANAAPNWVISSVSVTGAPVPEPAFFASLAGLGLLGFAVIRRARANASTR